MDYKMKVNKWKNSNRLNQELHDELLSMTDKELQEAFYKDLEFGTGGMRGIMGVGTNRMNVITIAKATYGFAKYLLKNDANAKEKGVVIAHDNRLHNEEFTLAAANVLTNLGIKTYIFDSLRPTPELSFAVRYLSCCGGIVITASHNPKEYNGYKIYNDEGNQLILAQSDKVLAEINAIEDELSIDMKGNPSLLIKLSSTVDEAYYQMVMDTSLRKEIDKSNIKVVYTPQHGTGYVAVTTVLKRMGYSIIEVKEQCFPSATFENTKSPNPEMKEAYDLAIEYAKKYDADLICTTDPDCDRVGIVLFDAKKTPIYMTGNQTAAILIEYLLSTRKEKHLLPANGIMYNTIVTSPLGAKIASSYGVKTEQTLTGFKYIGDKIARSIEKNGPIFQIGYEESYGYLINPSVRDKDGVQSVMLVCEMASYYKHQKKSLLDVFEEIQRKFGYYAESQYSYQAPGKSGLEKIASIIEKLRRDNLSELAGEKVVIREDYLRLIKEENQERTTLNYEKSNVLRYILEDGSFVAIRPSGTEPKCKFYFSIMGSNKQIAKERHDKIRSFVLQLIQ